MALDIEVRTHAPHSEATPTLSLEDDGYYWFLHPLFERIRGECGKYLDLYGDASFTRADYPRLRRALDEAAEMAHRQPRAWKVHVGLQLKPVRKELYQTIERSKLLEIIGTLRSMVDVADRLGGVLECSGD